MRLPSRLSSCRYLPSLLLLLGGVTLAQAQPAQTQPDIPEGYRAVPFLSEEPQREFEGAEQVLEEGRDYAALLVTNKGTMTLDLFEEETPETVNNFVFLARHHFYDGVVFHRVLDGFMAQTGDPTGTGTGGPGYAFGDEIAEGLSFDREGVLAMANAGPDTNGSQFFITFAATPWLDGAHTIFGRVTDGIDVLGDLQRIDPSAGAGTTPNVVVRPDQPLSAAQEQGAELTGEADTTVEAYLTEALGEFPAAGETFEIGGVRGVVGRGADGAALVGFFTEQGETEPDVIESVTILEREG